MSDSKPANPGATLERTPLYQLHAAHQARMVPFAGFEMPLHYAPGVLKEHLHTRAAAGLFDVSHMGQIVLRAKRGRIASAALALERLVPVDLLSLEPGRQRYAFFTNDRGGILDDLMVSNLGDHLHLVVNAACKATDEAHLRAHLSDVCEIERLDRALIALQGPGAEAALARLAPDVQAMRFMDVRTLDILGAECVVTRSGYTGEDGFELSLPPGQAAGVAAALLQDVAVAPIGLGARDSLRLEAGMCLYGADIDATTTPAEAALSWAIQPARRRDGERQGCFPGADIIVEQIANGPSRCRVGFSPNGRAPVRAGAAIFSHEDAREAIGNVTSGGFSPSLDRPIAMGYLPAVLAHPGTAVFAEVRGQRLPMTVAPLPFITPKFKRSVNRTGRSRA